MDKKNNSASNNAVKTKVQLANNKLKVKANNISKGNNINKTNNVSKNIKVDNVSIFKKINNFVDKNYLVIGLVVLLIAIILLTYFYSDFFRPNNKIKKLTNNLTYNKDRERIDFCGDDNYIKDKIRSGVKLNKNENSITFLNPNVNLYDLGLSSEYYINIENSDSNDNGASKYYKVAKVSNYNKIYLQKSEDSESIRENEEKPKNVVVTYFRPSSNKNIYKYKLLTDYYICSSFNSFLVGKHKLDYCDVNMINRALHFGARYIELEVMNKEVKNDTEPIVCTGIEKGNIITSLNYLMFDDCIRQIAGYAFSEKAIANYNDPLFLYLNLKTGTNISTNNKIHDIIVENLSKYLLSSDYNHINISKLTLCELRRKLVILTNRPCPGSTLDNIITCSSDKPYLKRIKMSDLDRFKNSKTPKLEIISRNVRFNNDLDSYVTIFDKNMDLIKSGVKAGDVIQINNANNPVNNSGLTLNKIKNVTKNMIIFETQGLFVDEKPGSQIVMNIYDESYVSLSSGIEEFNKENITIIVPDTEFYTKNYDYKRGQYRGCQFVTMNFQNQDKQMEKYFRQFQKRSFQFKPEVLINEIELPKSVSLNTLVPKEKTSAKYSVDYGFLANIGKEGFVICSLDESLRLINEDRNVKFSKSFFPSNSNLMIVKGLDNNNESISFKLGNRYLHTNDNCCYLYFSEAPPSYLNTLMKNNFRQNASFIPLKPNKFKKGFNSFGIKKKHIINRENVEFLYQLKLRNYFSPSKKIYTKQVSKYNVKFEFNLGDGEGRTNGVNNDNLYRSKVLYADDNSGEGRIMVVLKPIIEVNSEFLPLGDIIVPRSQLTGDDGVIEQFQDIRTVVYSGAVDKPKDYELIYDNKYFTTENKPLKKAGIQFSVWKPIPNNGYSAVSVVFNKGYQKPSLNEIVCVSNEFLKEVDLNSKPLWFHSKSSLIFWKNQANNYAHVFNSIVNDPATLPPIVPNPIDNLIFDVITEETDFSSRLYLDKNIGIDEESKYSSIFSFVEDSKPESSGFGVYDYLMEIENNKNKIMSYNTEGNSKMCVSLPQPYWTNIFDLRDQIPGSNQDNQNNEEKYTLDIEQCKGEKYIGTNWNILEDKTIRLKDHSDYCMTYNSKPNSRNPYYGTQNKKSQLYLEKCSEDLKNQQFLIENGQVKLFNPEASENKYCLHHDKKNDIKIEECGSKKYTLLWKWGDNIRRVDKCSQSELEEYMKENVNHIKDCINTNYYVIYREKIDNSNRVFKYKLFCDEDEAEDLYEKYKGKYSVTALYLNNKIIKKNIKGNVEKLNELLENYCKGLESLSKYCEKCTYPDRIMCSENTYIDHEFNYSSNNKILEELVTKCTKLKPSLDKCEKDRRQKFITTTNNPDFCLQEGKEVFVYIFDKEQFSSYNVNNPLNINISRKENESDRRQVLTGIEAKLPQRVDNLLAEPIDYDNYHLFVRGILKEAENSKYYKILFKQAKTGGLNSFYVPKTSYDIFLNKPATYDELEIGTKVLCNYSLPTAIVAYKFKQDGKIKGINNGYVRWLAVVVEKLENNYVRVIFSINSYESDLRRQSICIEHKNRPYSTINLDKIVKANDCVLLRKPPTC
jgi:hypothetical protein